MYRGLVQKYISLEMAITPWMHIMNIIDVKYYLCLHCTIHLIDIRKRMLIFNPNYHLARSMEWKQEIPDVSIYMYIS